MTLLSASFWHREKWQLGVALTRLGLANMLGIIPILGSSACAQSQILRDDTLGAEHSIVPPNFNGQPTVVEINGGAIRGANLFHSFLEFNIAAGQEAYFISPNANIQNILARVTGGNRSQILGKLGVLGSNANLFLINPNGIIFGQGSQLAVGGSFVATTANAIAFGNQGFFSVSTPNLPPLLTVNPSAFLFNQIGAKPITHQSSLQVPQGRSLLLLGGDVGINGGVLLAPGGRIELGGLADV
jgi:filamentous hemagglutinin family protein